MKKIKSVIGFFTAMLVLAETNSLYATHEFSFGVNAAATANNMLLANPPLPMLYYNKGEYKFTIQPYIFNGKMDFIDSSPSGDFRQRGEFRGWGAGGSASYAFHKKWGAYLFIVGSAISDANFAYSAEEAGRTTGNHQELTAVNASFVTFNTGFAYQFFGKKEGGFSLPLFAGPTITRVNFSQSILERYNKDDPFQKGRTHTDFDMKGSGFVPGFLLGVQAGIPMGKYFKLNPFAIVGLNFQDKLSYDLGTVRTDLESANPQNTLARVKSGEKMEIPQAFGGVGINLVFRPWGLSLNLTAPLLKRAIVSAFNTDVTQFSISYSFGKYQK